MASTWATVPVNALAFADDPTLVCKDARSAQRILSTVQGKLASNGLHIKPSKCFSLSLKSGQFDKTRKFSLNDTLVDNIDSAPMKFLGLYIYGKHQKSNTAKFLISKLTTLMAKVDRLLIRGQYKVRIYDQYVTSCIRFDMSVCDVAQSNLDALDTVVRKYIRKWCGMPQSTHIGYVFHSSGLGISSPSHLYRVGHASTLAVSTNSDPVLQSAIQATLDSDNAHNNAQHSEVADLVQGATNTRDIKTKARQLSDSIVNDLAGSKVKQGEHGWIEALSSMDDDVTWKSCLVGLSEATFSFVTRALVDALPTNSNLALWKKVLSPNCGSCHSSNQTLLHVLNHCQSKLAAYTWRHNNVLLSLRNFLSSKLPDMELRCDLHVSNNQFSEFPVHTVPYDIISTNLRPDICMIDRSSKTFTIVELTVPYESNISAAQERKSIKYMPLVAGLQELGYNTTFYSVEICSRGVIAQGTSAIMRKLCHISRRESKLFLQSLSRLVMRCSYVIFKEKDNRSAMFESIIHI